MVKYKYTAYGKVTVTKDTDGLADANPFKYKGYYFDLESGMYYCHTRYYVPEWGRWLNADSPLYTDTYEFDKLNFFTYCGNSPILRVDIEGQDWEFWSHFGTRQVANVGLTWRNYGKSFVFRDYYESYDGHVAEHSGELSSFFGIGASAYLGIGANISIGFNLNQIVDSLNTIWGY